MIATLFLGLLISATSFAASKEGSVGNEYTLGRVLTGHLNENLLTLYHLDEDDNLISDAYSARSGRDGTFAIHVVPGIGIMHTRGGFLYLQGLPEINVLWKGGNSNRFSISLAPGNLWVGGNSSGFEQPFLLGNRHAWSFLSRGGDIGVDPRDYETAFLFGPLLNPGQFRNDFVLNHTIHSSAAPYKELSVSVSPKIGIAEGLQFGMDFGYMKKDSLVGYGGGWYEPPSYLTEELEFGGKLDYRYKGLFSSLNSRFNRGFPETFEYPSTRMDESRLAAEAGLLLGERVSSINQVRGNWDGLNSFTLGSGQLLNVVSVDYRKSIIKWDYPSWVAFGPSESQADTLSLGRRARYGFLHGLEIGDEFMATLDWSNGLEQHYDWRLRLAFNLVPLREYGPAKASDHEYYNGYSFKKGDLRGSIEYRPPFLREEEPYWFLGIYERVEAFRIANSLQGYSRSWVSNDVAAAEKVGAEREYADLTINATYGVTDWFTLSNAFSYKKYTYYSGGESFDSIYENRPESNPVFTEQATMTFNVSRKKRLALSFLFARQTDDTYGDREKRADSSVRNWMLLFHYQGELDS